MSSPTHAVAIAAVVEAVEEHRSKAHPTSSQKLGRRLKGTSTFQLSEPVSNPLVIMQKVAGGSIGLYLGAVLPGGSLVEPIANVTAEPWSNIPQAGNVAGAEIFELAVKAGNLTASDVRGATLAQCKALTANLVQARRIRKRADQKAAVFKPCLDLYDLHKETHPEESRMARLTDHLLGAKETTAGIVAERAEAKHGGGSPDLAMSGFQSMKRSAGTNYQGLVALAISEDLLTRHSCWYVHYPPPQEYIQRLALRFTPKPGLDVEIDPDIDILLRNAAWPEGSADDEPIVLLSVKTSLADRAGSAARWKMYFDVATHSCPFDGQLDGCAWHDQGLRFAKPDLRVRLQHCIVTANIYKVESDDRFAEEGELQTAQTKANTFMFDQRYATRTGPNVQMEDWKPLTELLDLLVELSDEKQLPH